MSIGQQMLEKYRTELISQILDAKEPDWDEVLASVKVVRIIHQRLLIAGDDDAMFASLIACEAKQIAERLEELKDVG